MKHLNNFKTWNYDITWGIIFMMNTYISISEENISNILKLKKQKILIDLNKYIFNFSTLFKTKPKTMKAK